MEWTRLFFQLVPMESKRILWNPNWFHPSHESYVTNYIELWTARARARFLPKIDKGLVKRAFLLDQQAAATWRRFFASGRKERKGSTAVTWQSCAQSQFFWVHLNICEGVGVQVMRDGMACPPLMVAQAGEVKEEPAWKELWRRKEMEGALREKKMGPPAPGLAVSLVEPVVRTRWGESFDKKQFLRNFPKVKYEYTKQQSCKQGNRSRGVEAKYKEEEQKTPSEAILDQPGTQQKIWRGLKGSGLKRGQKDFNTCLRTQKTQLISPLRNSAAREILSNFFL